LIIGLNLSPLTEARRELLEIPPNIRGVIVLSIDDDSAFLGLGVRPGDVIESSAVACYRAGASSDAGAAMGCRDGMNCARSMSRRRLGPRMPDGCNPFSHH
jgi:hypothetical protein